MSFYKIKESLSWSVVVFLAVLLVIYGFYLSADQRLLRVAVNKQDSLSQELAEVVKSQLQAQGTFQVAIVKTSSSEESQKKLLNGDADLAIVMPAALPNPRGLKRISPLAQVSTHLLVNKKAKAGDLSDLDPARVALGADGSDQRMLLASSFKHIGKNKWLEKTQNVNFEALPNSQVLDAAIVTTNTLDEKLSKLLATGKYDLLSLPASALSAPATFIDVDTIYRAIYGAKGRVIPKKDVSTIGTFHAVVASGKLDSSLAVTVEKILNNSMTSLALEKFGRNTVLENKAYQLLPEHVAVQRMNDMQLTDRYLAKMFNWLESYCWFLLILIVLSIMVAVRIYETRSFNKLAGQKRVKSAVESLMQELIEIEEQLGNEHDLKSLRSLYERTFRIRERGNNLIMQQEDYPHSHAYIFIEQVHFIINRLEDRLGLMSRISMPGDRAA